MAELTNKKKQRGGHRSYVTKIINRVNETLENYDPSKEIKLKQHKIVLVERLTTLQTLDDQILELITQDADIEKEIDEAGKFREDIHEVMIKIDNLLLSATKAEASAVSTASSSVAAKKASTAKLPKLEIQKFGGDASQWFTFWDNFVASIHNNEELSDVERFSYLKGLLTGPAAATVAGLALTESNYQNAVELLKTRFANKQVIVNCHMDRLMNIAPLNSGANVNKLRAMLDEVETQVRGLSSLGISSKDYGSLLVSVLFKDKLPNDIKLLIGRKLSSENWTLENVLKILRVEVETRERCGISAISESKKPAYYSSNYTKHQATGSVLMTAEGGKKPNCTYCQSKHPSVDCHILTDVNARKHILRKNGRCYVCLRKNHIASRCTSAGKCYKCSGRHHVTICDFGQEKLRPQSFPRAENNKPPSNNPGKPPEATHSGYIGSQNAVLLRTARVKLSNPNSESDGIVVRLIFDDGSQRSYLSQTAREKLNLETCGRAALLINVFGQTAQQLETRDQVQFTVESLQDDFKITIDSYVVPEICAPLQRQKIQEARHHYPYLQNIPISGQW